MEKKKVFFVKLGLELVIVFIGMTLAIFVNNYQNVKDEQKARLIFFETFLKELNNFENSTDILIKKIDTYLNEFSKEMDQKKRPKLKSIDFSFFSNTLIIGSAFTEDNFSAIGSKFLSSISRGTSLIKVINQKIQNYKRNTAQLLYFQELLYLDQLII